MSCRNLLAIASLLVVADGCGSTAGSADAGATDGSPSDSSSDCSSTGAAVVVGAPSGPALEGGASVTYELSLAAEPCAEVNIALTADAQLELASSSVTFSVANWQQPQAVTVTAIHDFAREGAHNGIVSHVAGSMDSSYEGTSVDDATIAIEDRAHMSLVTTGSDGESRLPRVSNDGRFVAFASAATTLVASDANALSDIFRYDDSDGTILRVSEAAGGGDANGKSSSLALSADGDLVAFFSEASNIVGDAISAGGEIYLRSMSGGSTTLISRQCIRCSNELSSAIDISGDGNFVAYATRRRLLGDTDTEYDIFVHEVENGALTQASLNSTNGNGTAFWGHNAFSPTLSSSGQFAGFRSAAQNLATPDITVQNFHAYVKNRSNSVLTRTTKHSGGESNCDGVRQASNSSAPRITADGNLAVFDSACIFNLESAQLPDTNDARDIFLRNIGAQTTERINVATDGAEANQSSRLVAMSDDARFILFISDATNLVADDTNDAADLFLRDRFENTTTRLSVDEGYGELPRGVLAAGLSRNGRYVVFTSLDNAMATDTNDDIADVYLMALR